MFVNCSRRELQARAVPIISTSSSFKSFGIVQPRLFIVSCRYKSSVRESKDTGAGAFIEVLQGRGGKDQVSKEYASSSNQKDAIDSSALGIKELAEDLKSKGATEESADEKEIEASTSKEKDVASSSKIMAKDQANQELASSSNAKEEASSSNGMQETSSSNERQEASSSKEDTEANSRLESLHERSLNKKERKLLQKKLRTIRISNEKMELPEKWELVAKEVAKLKNGGDGSEMQFKANGKAKHFSKSGKGRARSKSRYKTTKSWTSATFRAAKGLFRAAKGLFRRGRAAGKTIIAHLPKAKMGRLHDKQIGAEANAKQVALGRERRDIASSKEIIFPDMPSKFYLTMRKLQQSPIDYPPIVEYPPKLPPILELDHGVVSRAFALSKAASVTWQEHSGARSRGAWRKHSETQENGKEKERKTTETTHGKTIPSKIRSELLEWVGDAAVALYLRRKFAKSFPAGNDLQQSVSFLASNDVMGHLYVDADLLKMRRFLFGKFRQESKEEELARMRDQISQEEYAFREQSPVDHIFLVETSHQGNADLFETFVGACILSFEDEVVYAWLDELYAPWIARVHRALGVREFNSKS